MFHKTFSPVRLLQKYMNTMHYAIYLQKGTFNPDAYRDIILVSSMAKSFTSILNILTAKYQYMVEMILIADARRHSYNDTLHQ